MVSGVEIPVETPRPDCLDRAPGLGLRLFGPLEIRRNSAAVTLPASRKVRALLAYLAVAAAPVPRQKLCELLWDIPDDPRGELRWTLSKIRGLIDEPGRPRVITRADAVWLDLSDCYVDAAELAQANQDVATVDLDQLRRLADLLAGDFLEGLEIERSPVFSAWLAAQRRQFRERHAVLLEHLVCRLPDEESARYLDRWLELAPFDCRVHELLLSRLARHGRIRDGEEHLAATVRAFEAEGLDPAALRLAWRKARTRTGPAASAAPVEQAQPDNANQTPSPARRASIAVMPFADRSSVIDPRGCTGDALAYDMITRLAKLRSLFVIAQGSVFALHERRIGPEEAGRLLNVDYVASGSVQRQGKHLTVQVELTETRTAHIVWSDRFTQTLDDAFLVLDEVGDRIVASIASEIETSERNRAVLKPPNSLDAWEAHHRGLWHAYRFNRADNEQARHFFEMAIGLDPTFARAHAGLSFTYFQNAFLGWADRGSAIDRAFEAAGQSLMADDRDPAAHWAMGRALWLRGRQDQSIVELEQAIDLSPNFALGHYMLAMVHSQGGDAACAISSADHSRHLSPFDPLLFAMLGSRAMALARLGRYDEAAEWGIKAAARPNAHAHIPAIAALCLSLAGRTDEARLYVSAARATVPAYRIEDFLTAMRFDADGAALFRAAGARIGLD